jgi:hypothetical protein
MQVAVVEADTILLEEEEQAEEAVVETTQVDQTVLTL